MKKLTIKLSTVWLIVMLGLSAQVNANSKHLRPISGIDSREKLNFWVGAGLFRSPWVAAPASTKGRDGLGPLFNARSCDACHRNGAGGKLPEDGLGLVVRVSEYHSTTNTYSPSPIYGSQIQSLSIKSFIGAHALPEESKVDMQWSTETLTINQNQVQLQKPRPVLRQLNYGALGADVRLSPRLAPPVFGLGLLDALSDASILNNEDITDNNKDGISGKANRVPDLEAKTMSVGRFGHKAEQPTLRQQVAGALNEDIGLTSKLFPNETCTSKQTLCLKFPNGIFKDEKFEIGNKKLSLLVNFSKNLAPPSSTKRALNLQDHSGFEVFLNTGCQQCHIPSLNTVNNNGPYAYTDLLLHDMGKPLADNRAIYDANGQEWRTAPLWGLHRKLQNKTPRLLHDGRASSIEQAILWHAGEARQSRSKYWSLTQAKKDTLLNFLEQL